MPCPFSITKVFLYCCLRFNHTAGGALSLAYDGNAVDTNAKVKEQIMLTGGVITSMAISLVAFDDLINNRTGANAAFARMEDLKKAAPANVWLHAVFCYSWWDNPRNTSDGYWLCKNRCVCVHMLCMSITAGPAAQLACQLELLHLLLCGSVAQCYLPYMCVVVCMQLHCMSADTCLSLLHHVMQCMHGAWHCCCCCCCCCCVLLCWHVHLVLTSYHLLLC
jgi:hypothetical protein